jgi:hypothetical protein
MKPGEMRDLTRLYPMFPGTRSFRPVDMLLDGREHPAIYAYRVDDDWTQLILCNNHDNEAVVGAPLSGDQADTGSLGLDPDASYYLHDFWNDRFLGEIRGDESLGRPLGGHQALTYSLHRKKDHPQFLSTNRHIMQGLVDLDGVRWDADTLTYSGTAMVAAGEPFVITIANNGHTPGRVSASVGQVGIAPAGEGLSRLTLASEEHAAVAWSVTWSRGGAE